MNEPLRNMVAGVFLAGLGVWIWIYAGTFPDLAEGYPGPALFPRVIAAGLVFSGLGLLAGSLRRAEGLRRAMRVSRPAWAGPARVALALALVVLFPLMRAWLGFVPAVGLLSFAVAWVLKARLLPAALTALLSALLIYGVFSGVLGVPL